MRERENTASHIGAHSRGSPAEMASGRSIVAYLGPTGTFTEQAVRLLPGDVAERPMGTIVDALEAVRTHEVDSAVVPLENSIEGAVGATLDSLATGEQLHIVREIAVPVVFGLFARANTELNSVKTFASHPHAEAQCRTWIGQHLPHAQFVRTASTADAAAATARGEFDAAICAAIAGSEYGLVQLGADIGDNGGAVTRFVQVARPGNLPARTGNDATSIVVALKDDHAGALQEALTQFSVRGVNLTRIESRPTKQQLGRYLFFLDCAGHITDSDVGEALAGLYRSCPEVRFLGSYPRWTQDESPLAEVHDEQPASLRVSEDYAVALQWVDRIRAGGTG